MSSLLAIACVALQLTASPADRPLVRLLRGGVAGGDETLHIDLASALAAARGGDLLVLDPGRWVGAGNRGLLVSQAVTIRGRAGADETVIDCEGLERAFEVTVSGVRLEGLTVRGGKQDSGGALLVTSGSATLADVVVEGCRASFGGAVCVAYLADVRLERCVLRSNDATMGGGVDVGGAAQLVDCVLEGNHADYGGGLHTISEAPVRLSGTCLRSNSADVNGGAVSALIFGNVWLDRCSLVENTASNGGGLSASLVAGVVFLTNCLIARNQSASGVAGVTGSPIGIQGCTIVDNASGGTISAGVYCPRGSVLLDSIVRGNRSANPSTLLQQVQTSVGFAVNGFPGPGLATFACDVEGIVGLPTNFDLDPLFVNPVGGDYHLSPGSPCIDAGITISLNLVQRDIDGEPRVLGRSVDVGSDEVPPND